MFTNPPATGYGIIIRNDKGEVMAASSTRGAPTSGSKEAKVLVCHHAVEFSFGLGFRDLVIQGDNITVMHKTTKFGTSSSRLGHIFLDIHSSLASPYWFFVSFIHREDNFVAHSLARFAKHISDDVIWIKDSPPPALKSLYFDLAHIAS
ncbi:uncharacterized protein LOC142635174 [Castanea sativa]|uniref:uncharacterized protein LOC142635174 n=1 Tax=Castanea sativa TaxID=21020 RepID=UPI003F64BEC5